MSRGEGRNTIPALQGRVRNDGSPRGTRSKEAEWSCCVGAVIDGGKSGTAPAGGPQERAGGREKALEKRGRKKGEQRTREEGRQGRRGGVGEKRQEVVGDGDGQLRRARGWERCSDATNRGGSVLEAEGKSGGHQQRVGGRTALTRGKVWRTWREYYGGEGGRECDAVWPPKVLTVIVVLA